MDKVSTRKVLSKKKESIVRELKVGTWSRYNIDGQILEEINYDNKGRNPYEITYYNNGTVREYRDYFSKTVKNTI